MSVFECDLQLFFQTDTQTHIRPDLISGWPPCRENLDRNTQPNKELRQHQFAKTRQPPKLAQLWDGWPSKSTADSYELLRVEVLSSQDKT
jgi:hypothetical protein